MSTAKRMRCDLTLSGITAADLKQILPILRADLLRVRRSIGICTNYECWVLETSVEHAASLKCLARVLGASFTCTLLADEACLPTDDSALEAGLRPPAAVAPAAPTE
jgi:hypothetical protein